MNIIILSIIVVMFLFETIVSVMNYNNRKAPLPENVKDLYDEEKYNTWLSYTMSNFRFGMLANIVTTSL
ncbi:MAG: hypothetical protein ACPF9F_00620, partial [Acholeplasmataceae bacterium]